MTAIRDSIFGPSRSATSNAHLEAAGHGYHCSSDYRDVIETLKSWGVLRSGIHVQ